MARTRSPKPDHYESNDELFEELLALQQKLAEQLQDIKSFSVAHPGGSQTGPIGVYADRQKRSDELRKILEERGFLKPQAVMDTSEV